ncbi:hypothetical protein [Halalkalicoccus subterraneus]|uniref:hypothetical protein n=1 Tax=Halalkalicoccus subterraneus TaxID=2675002 RepID=UPI0013CEACE7|nr:hypothetical protein [Halalkalicoccus subterraneus]
MGDFRKLWDRIGIGGVIILGLALFFFPEPTTSFIGVIIIITATLTWLEGWYSSRKLIFKLQTMRINEFGSIVDIGTP